MALFSSISDCSVLSLGPLHSTALYHPETSSDNDSGYCLGSSNNGSRTFQISYDRDDFDGRLSPVVDGLDVMDISGSDASCNDAYSNSKRFSTTLHIVGERLPCIGQESPSDDSVCEDKYTPFHRVNRLLLSELDTDWDNSQLDASCSTCCTTQYVSTNKSVEAEQSFEEHMVSAQKQLKSSVRHLQFMKHMLSCASCSSGESCPIASGLEGDLSSFFEVELETECYDETLRSVKESKTGTDTSANGTEAMEYYSSQYAVVEMTTADVYESMADYKNRLFYKGKQLKEVNLDDLHSEQKIDEEDDRGVPHSVTAYSDTSAFIDQPLSFQPVSLQAKVAKEKKPSFVKKISQFCKYLHHLRKTHRNNSTKI